MDPKLIESYQKKQEEVKEKPYFFEKDAHMHASQTSEMITKPDCGENSYKGSDKLKGKIAIITGEDSGIGRSISIAFSREGASIVIVYHSNKSDAEDVKQLLEKTTKVGMDTGTSSTSSESRTTSPSVMLIQADISKKEECQRVVQEVTQTFGNRIDILVNNAGVQYDEELNDITPARINEVMSTNVYGPLYLAQECVPHMSPGSAIVNNSSINAYKGNSSLLTYSMSKGALTTLSRSLALTLAEKQIRVNCVAPGPIFTPFIPGTWNKDDPRLQHFGESTIMKRAGQPAECAAAFVFLASSDSSFMTGNTIHLNGGQYMAD